MTSFPSDSVLASNGPQLLTYLITLCIDVFCACFEAGLVLLRRPLAYAVGGTHLHIVLR